MTDDISQKCVVIKIYKKLLLFKCVILIVRVITCFMVESCFCFVISLILLPCIVTCILFLKLTVIACHLSLHLPIYLGLALWAW